MNRRRLLALIGTGSVVPIAGCLGGRDSPDESTPDGPVLDDQPCPPYETDRESAVCSHTVDPDAASVYLDASPTSAALEDGLPAEEITLTLHNQSASDLDFNPGSWSVRLRSGEEWAELEREWVGDGKRTVPAGETHTWTFTEAVEAIQPEPELSSGLYAAEIGVPDPSNDDEWIDCIALVRFEEPA